MAVKATGLRSAIYFLCQGGRGSKQKEARDAKRHCVKQESHPRHFRLGLDHDFTFIPWSLRTAMATVCFRNILLLTLLVQLQTARTQTVCDVCEQRPTACRRIAGLYTVTVLTQGTYNPVVEIPAQACNLNITELAPSHNYLAVRTETGENIVNGYWSVGSTGSFRGAGTQFEYNRGAASCPGECILAKGPVNQPIVVQLLYYSKNPGIAYEFVLPGDVLFKPFDETAPSVESRTRTSHHYQGRRQQTNASRAEPYDPAYARRQEEATPVQEPRRQATPVQEPRRQASPVQEPRRQQTPIRQGRPEVKGGDTGVGTKDSTDYRGVSYGSHTLGGRGQSYTFQHQDSRSAGSASEDPDAGRTQPRETLRRRPVVRGQPTAVRPLPPQTYLSSEGLHGHESQGSARRGGLADRTYSQSLESDNRLQPYDNVNVEQIGRPTLTIGGGGGGREYMWTISGFTQCSLTCGGGFQETRVVCVLTSAGTQVVVTEENCANVVKPRVQRVSCHNEPCAPGWVTDEWSECSVTCGSGTQTRRIECRHRLSENSELSVSASQCDQAQKPAIAQQCETNPCAQWQTGEWGPCSTECGGGERGRQVECVDQQGVQIPDSYCSLDKPQEREECNTQLCNTQWWFTDWSNVCSTDCGPGLTSRSVVCRDRMGRQVLELSCEDSKRPQDRQACESSAQCGGQWFTGPWSECSENCGEGVRTRQVVCMQREAGRGSQSVTREEHCQGLEKPQSEEECLNIACGAQYYMTDWSECSVSCGSGIRTRQVQCLDASQQRSNACDPNDAPPDREQCESTSCREVEELHKLQQTSRSDDRCKNTFWNCRLVVQARLCSYSYYNQVCCAACRRSHTH